MDILCRRFCLESAHTNAGYPGTAVITGNTPERFKAALLEAKARAGNLPVEITAYENGRVSLKTLVSGTGPVLIQRDATYKMLDPAVPGTITEL